MGFRSLTNLRPWFFLLALGAIAPEVQAQFEGMEIGVRSGIDRRENKKRKRNLEYALDTSKHAHLYLLASVMPHPSIGPLITEVNALAIAKELNDQMQAHGFHHVDPGQPPEIVITVEYGRGYLPNPYSDNDDGKMRNNLTNADPFHPWPLHEVFFSLAEDMKRQKADEEKLIIEVRAWKYPPPPNPKDEPLLLWMTSMAVDDPDHRDLNEIYKQMLAAGAPHFDKPIDREHQVIVIPEGHVKVGTPEVIKDKLY